MSNQNPQSLDEIDWRIVELLAADPRRPYTDISERLKQDGYELSSEGARYRVQKIIEAMSIFFMVHPNEQEWEVMIFLFEVTSEVDAKQEVTERLLEDDFWLVSRGFGTYDLYAIATVASTMNIERLISQVRSYDKIESVSYMIETKRTGESSNYLPIRDID